MKNSLMRAMKNSISEVLEKMFYLSIEIDEDTDSYQIDENVDYHSSKLSFKGPFSGTFHSTCPENLLKIMTVNFLGVDDTEVTQTHMIEVVKEMGNIIVGNIFSNYDANIEFQLGIPEIVTEKISFADENDENNINLIVEALESFLGFKIEIE